MVKVEVREQEQEQEQVLHLYLLPHLLLLVDRPGIPSNFRRAVLVPVGGSCAGFFSMGAVSL
jgi:hypothetical protein